MMFLVVLSPLLALASAHYSVPYEGQYQPSGPYLPQYQDQDFHSNSQSPGPYLPQYQDQFLHSNSQPSGPYLAQYQDQVLHSNPHFVPPLANNPSVRSYGYGLLGPQNRDSRSHLDMIGTRGTYGWGTYRPTYYDATDRKVHPWTTTSTGLLPWADSFHGSGLPTNWQVARAVSGAYYGDEDLVYSPYDMYTNSQVNPLAADPLLPGGESPALAGANPHGPYGMGTINLGTPVGLSYMGTGSGTGVAWLKNLPGHPLPYLGYGPQGSAGMGSGTPLTEHPVFQTLPGLYHPPASNVFY